MSLVEVKTNLNQIIYDLQSRDICYTYIHCLSSSSHPVEETLCVFTPIGQIGFEKKPKLMVYMNIPIEW